MAKIGKVPSADELIRTKPLGASGQYGPRFTWRKEPGSVELLHTEAGDEFTFAAAGGPVGPTMYPLEKLDKPHLYVPYVNAFLRDHGKVVHRNVKANTYRLIDAPKADPVTAAVSGTKPVTFKPEDESVPFAAIPKEDYIGAMLGAFARPEDEVMSDLRHFASTGSVATPPYKGTPATLAIEDEIVPEPEPEHEHEPEPEPVKIVKAAPVLARPSTAEVVGLERLPLEKVVITKNMVTVGDIVTTPANYAVLADAWKLRQAGQPGNVLITGPAGAAKTALARSFAASVGLPFLKVDGGSIRSADDWSGMVRQDPNTKTWSHHWSPFAQVLRRGEPALILIDELNRTESPQALNALLGLLDMTGQLLVPDANDVLTLPAGIMVVATANIGPEFIGTLPLDGAVRQRFGFGVRMDFLPQGTETKLLTRLTGLPAAVASRLVKVADMQRQNRNDMQLYPSGSVISTRLLLDVARRITTCDADPREALWSTLLGQFEAGDEAALTICVETQFPSPDAATLPSMDDDDEGADDPFMIKVK